VVAFSKKIKTVVLKTLNSPANFATVVSCINETNAYLSPKCALVLVIIAELLSGINVSNGINIQSFISLNNFTIWPPRFVIDEAPNT
jgi:hypothetical protein